jgi:hypothetical protein
MQAEEVTDANEDVKCDIMRGLVSRIDVLRIHALRIHVLPPTRGGVDGRDKPGHDENGRNGL